MKRALFSTAITLIGLTLCFSFTLADEKPKADDAKPADKPKTESTESKPDAEKSAASNKNLPNQTLLINEQIAAGWKTAEIKKPAARSTDLEFMRRVFIDLIGRIPTTEEVLDYDQDSSQDKRGKLVRRLLYGITDSSGNSKLYQPKVNGHPATFMNGSKKEDLTFDYPDEYARHWSQTWTTWLMSRTGDSRYRDQMQVWLQLEFLKNTSYKEIVQTLLTASGKSNEKGAINFIAHHIGDPLPNDKKDLGRFDAIPITSRTTRLFLGMQTQCTQCHDHPRNSEWVQSDFWGVNAFFRQIDIVDDQGKQTRPARPVNNQMGAMIQFHLVDKDSSNSNGIVYYERRDGKLMAAKPNFLKDYAEAEKGVLTPNKTITILKDVKNRRQALSHYVVHHDNFARAYVNRIWCHLFGRGMNKEPSCDDFGSHNEIVHPELLNRLAEEFIKYKYDPKILLEWICQSDPYQLSHVANKDYADQKYDPYFARMPVKAMSPEVMFESLMVATRGGLDQSSEAKKKAREQWMNKLVRNFGDDEGNEQTFNGTIIQALLMMNGKELNDEISIKGSNAVAKVVERHARSGDVAVDAVLDELFLMTVNRHITPEERSKLKRIQQQGMIIKAESPKAPAESPPPKAEKEKEKTKSTEAPSPTRPANGKPPKNPQSQQPKPTGPAGVVQPSSTRDVSFYQDVFWALLNSSEFMLNH